MQLQSSVSDEQFAELVKNSFSTAEVMRKMGRVGKGGYYRTFKNRIFRQKLDISHFKGFGWSKGAKRDCFKKDISLYLTNQIPCESHKLKLRLIEEGYFERKCYTCNQEEWMGKLIPIELDHINGDRRDNSLSNLSIICPNCHAQTPTYKAKNRKDFAKISYCKCGKRKTSKAKRCQDCVMVKIFRCKCGNEIQSKQRRCFDCRKLYLKSSLRKTKINWPSNEELKKLVWEKPMSLLSKDLGVSDKAIAKRCKKLEIEIPNKGIWLRKN
jgi:hypothetical protein